MKIIYLILISLIITSCGTSNYSNVREWINVNGKEDKRILDKDRKQCVIQIQRQFSSISANNLTGSLGLSSKDERRFVNCMRGKGWKERLITNPAYYQINFSSFFLTSFLITPSHNYYIHCRHITSPLFFRRTIQQTAIKVYVNNPSNYPIITPLSIAQYPLKTTKGILQNIRKTILRTGMP